MTLIFEYFFPVKGAKHLITPDEEYLRWPRVCLLRLRVCPPCGLCGLGTVLSGSSGGRLCSEGAGEGAGRLSSSALSLAERIRERRGDIHTPRRRVEYEGLSLKGTATERQSHTHTHHRLMVMYAYTESNVCVFSEVSGRHLAEMASMQVTHFYNTHTHINNYDTFMTHLGIVQTCLDWFTISPFSHLK